MSEDFIYIGKAHRSAKGWCFELHGSWFFLNDNGNLSLVKNNRMAKVDNARAFTGAVNSRDESRYRRAQRVPDY